MPSKLNIGLVIGAAALLLAACGPEDKGLQDVETYVEEPAVLVTPEFDSAAAEDAMRDPLDGSSVATFENALEELQGIVSAGDFASLQSALQWLQFYDVSVGGDKQKLYTSLDGKSPIEIIEHVKLLNKNR
jgi:hypothetical protein